MAWTKENILALSKRIPLATRQNGLVDSDAELNVQAKVLGRSPRTPEGHALQKAYMTGTRGKELTDLVEAARESLKS